MLRVEDPKTGERLVIAVQMVIPFTFNGRHFDRGWIVTTKGTRLAMTNEHFEISRDHLSRMAL